MVITATITRHFGPMKGLNTEEEDRRWFSNISIPIWCDTDVLLVVAVPWRENLPTDVGL